MIQITAVQVPNPDALKFEIQGINLPEGSFEFERGDEGLSAIADQLFSYDCIVRVFIADNFITVSKKPNEGPDWNELVGPFRAMIKSYLMSKKPVTVEAAKPLERTRPEGELEEMINTIMEGHILPATRSDGGEITFKNFKDGKVEVELAGACVDCPFAPRTIKHGVEVLLKRHLPEVKEVWAENVNWGDKVQ